VHNINEMCDRIIRAAECVTNYMLAKLNIVFMSVMPVMVPILRSTEHVRYSVWFSVSKRIDFSNTLYG